MSFLVLIILHTLHSEGTCYTLPCCERALGLKSENALQLPVYKIRMCVVQISQDMASASLKTCLACSVQAWHFVIRVLCVNQGEKDGQSKLEGAEECCSSRLGAKHVLLPRFSALRQPLKWQKGNNTTVRLLKITPVARQSSKWQGCEISRDKPLIPEMTVGFPGSKCLFESWERICDASPKSCERRLWIQIYYWTFLILSFQRTKEGDIACS